MAAHVLTLFVSGDSPNGRRARQNVEALCGQVFGGCDVEVIDVVEQPDLAEAERVVATPMLVSRVPHAGRRVVGDLSDLRQVMSYFEMKSNTVVPSQASTAAGELPTSGHTP